MKTATIETDKGTITLELYAEQAPKTVANFEKLASEGFYDGLSFHSAKSDQSLSGRLAFRPAFCLS